jgi:hypothetical protein
MIPLNRRLETGSQGLGNPLLLIIVFKIVHYTLIAGRVGIGCQSRANFPTRQATEMASGSLLEVDIP